MDGTGARWLGIISTGRTLAADRSADAIFKDLESVEMPKLDASKRNDQAYMSANSWQKRQESARQAGRADSRVVQGGPEPREVPELMVERWKSIPVADPQSRRDRSRRSTGVSTQTKDAKFKLEAIFAKAQIKLVKSRSAAPPIFRLSTSSSNWPPKTPDGASLLYLRFGVTSDKEAKTALEDRILKDFPDSRYAEMIKGNASPARSDWQAL